MTVVALTVSSCSNDEPLVEPVQSAPLKFEVGAYPAYDDVRAVGTPDAGKTDWAAGDVVLIKVTDGGESETLTLTYGNAGWTPSEEMNVTGTPTIEVLYAPGCEWGTSGEVDLKSDDAPYGTFEYVVGDSDFSGNTVYVDFFGKRTYSRLRLVPGVTNDDVNVATTGFTPAGPVSAVAPSEGYELTTDAKGNAYLYGSFSSGATVQVTKDDVVLKEYTFSSATTADKSYAMDAVPYVTFTADATQTLTMSKTVETLEYSVGGGEWATLGTTTVTFGGDNGDLRLRGKSAIGTASEEDLLDNCSIITFGDEDVEVVCTGDIRTLVDYENYTTTSTANARFAKLFFNCTNLIKTPKLPSVTLASFCYVCMFEGCTSLTEAPELPATELAHSCYHSMFYGCTNLSVAPELPVTDLATDCYRQMFVDCTGLTEAPELPATILSPGCYAFMFSGCTSLDEAPELPATTLDYLCYYYMFSGCTSLTVAPTLPVTTLADDCYSSMFQDCTGLLTAPVLPATSLANGCYSSMFRGCTSLMEAPILAAQTLKERCYNLMFDGCTNLNEVTMLATDISASDCLKDWLEGVALEGTFRKNPAMTDLPSGSSGIPEGWTIQDYTTYMGGWNNEEELN